MGVSCEAANMKICKSLNIKDWETYKKTNTRYSTWSNKFTTLLQDIDDNIKENEAIAK